jgi:hypothetical protein
VIERGCFHERGPSGCPQAAKGEGAYALNSAEVFPSIRSKAAFWTCYLIAVFVALLINWPGRAFSDTIDMMYQARNLDSLTNWHSPFATFAFSLFGPVAGYPGGGLVMQTMLLLLWPARVLAGLVTGSSTPLRNAALIAWILVVIGFTVLAGQVVKDVLLLGFCSALLFAYEDKWHSRFGGRLGVFAILAAICLFRTPNLAIIALCTIAVALVACSRKISAFIAAASIVATLAVSVFIVNKFVLPAKDAPSEITLIFLDLSGISVIDNVDLFAEFAGRKLSNRSPEECYSPKRANAFVWGECKEYWEQISTLPTSELRRFWIKSIFSHPLAYMQNRIMFALELLANDDDKDFIVSPPPFTAAINTIDQIDIMDVSVREGFDIWQPSIGFYPFGNIAQLFFSRWSPASQPTVWITILMIGAVVSLRSKRIGSFPVTLTLSLAGLGNFLMYAAIGPAENLRYLLPTMFCALAVIVQTARHFEGKERQGVST